MEPNTQPRPQTICQPSQPLCAPGSTFQYRNSASTDLRATFARIAAQTSQAWAASQQGIKS